MGYRRRRYHHWRDYSPRRLNSSSTYDPIAVLCLLFIIFVVVFSKWVVWGFTMVVAIVKRIIRKHKGIASPHAPTDRPILRRIGSALVSATPALHPPENFLDEVLTLSHAHALHALMVAIGSGVIASILALAPDSWLGLGSYLAVFLGLASLVALIVSIAGFAIRLWSQAPTTPIRPIQPRHDFNPKPSPAFPQGSSNADSLPPVVPPLSPVKGQPPLNPLGSPNRPRQYATASYAQQVARPHRAMPSTPSQQSHIASYDPPRETSQPTPYAPVQKNAMPYRRMPRLLTPTELAFYQVLTHAVGSSFTIQCKVRLADLADYPRDLPRRQRVFWNSQAAQKHVDFLLCDPASSEPLLAIELDDPSHHSRGAQKRDAFKNYFFEQVGLPLLRVNCSQSYDVPWLQMQIRQHTG